MLVLVVCMVAAAAAAPARYDQRQEGEMNVRADVQNVVLLVAIPQKLPFSVSLLDGLFKNSKHAELQERADVHSMESFVEPSTPYRVEISGDAGTSAPDVRPVSGHRYVDEVVIAGRRAVDDSLKLLGAQEQCGPGRARDEEGFCRDVPDPPESPEVEVDKPKQDPAAETASAVLEDKNRTVIKPAS